MDIKTNDLKSDIEQSRPNAKESTVKQYLILIKKLQKLFDTDDYSFLSDPKAVYDKIKDNKFTSIRNTYNAIIITLMALNQKENLTELIDRYGLLRDELNQKYEDQQKAGNISENQKQNFVKLEEIEKMIDTMKSEIKEQNLKTKKELNGKEKELLMMYTIWNMLIRIPTRNEFSSVILVNKSAYKKLTEADKKKNNYLVVDKNKFFFIYNVYKTSKSYGEKKIDVEKDLAMILRSYIKLTKKKTGESLFTTSTGNQISPNVASQLLLKYSKKYIGKNISSTILRHIVLSDKFADVKTEMEETAAVTGHSVNTMLNVYIKDTPLITGDDEPSKDE